MIQQLRGEAHRTTLVCIDSYDNDVPTGRFFDPCLPPGRSFFSLMQLLQEMENTLEPSGTSPSVPDPLPSHTFGYFPSGELATFAVRVLFRQNMSWQGCVTWLEGQQEQHFRSVLELVLLMRDVLAQEKSA